MAERFLSLAGSIRVWFTSLHVQAVMPVTSAKRSGIFYVQMRRRHLITNASNKSIFCVSVINFSLAIGALVCCKKRIGALFKK